MNFSKLSGNATKIIVGIFFVAVLVGLVSIAQDKNSNESQIVQNSSATSLKQVEPKYVCMVNNSLFQREQIPVLVEGKTYYGCCEMCKGRLENDPRSRVAIDPVSGNTVDKAVSIIGASTQGSIYYFENKNNLQKFSSK